MLVAIVSDTHLPRGRRAIPAGCIDLMQAADLIVHAGDLTAMAILHELHEHGEVVAVHGNADHREVKAALPAQVELEVAGRRIGLVHDGGRRVGRVERLRMAFPSAAAVIFGHSHIPLHETSADGEFQIFNPGSPTDKRRAPHHTMGLLRADDRQLTFELVDLDSR